jgi:hypothetical protein
VIVGVVVVVVFAVVVVLAVVMDLSDEFEAVDRVAPEWS